MKIFIYNKYFPTCGGGEKHIGGIAEVLAKKHQITILHAGELDVAKVSARLNLNLSNIQFVSLGNSMDIDFKVLEFVEKNNPDIFINATYFSLLLTPTNKNISLVFFPKYFRVTPLTKKDHLKFKLGNLVFKNYTNTIRFHEGFEHEEYIHSTVGRWSTEKATLLINKPFKKVDIFFKNLTHTIINDRIREIKIHNNKMNFEIHQNKIRVNFNTAQACGIHLIFNPFVPSETNQESSDSRKLGLFVTTVYSDALNFFSRLLIQLWNFPLFRNKISRFYNTWQTLTHHHYYLEFLRRNQNIMNSKYTSDWTTRIYGSKEINKRILYPPVDIDIFKSDRAKNKSIIAVGRFFVGGHNKKQIELIKAFRKLYDTYPEAREYTFHLCGGTHPEDIHQNYLALCENLAQGYPIKIHKNIELKELVCLYGEAKIFWHAAGMNENEQLHPDKFEHFGITTVEAMASGCVPVVLGLAGQKEIVSHGETGLLWNTEDELLQHTLLLINNESLCNDLAKNAITCSSKYSRSVFNQNVESIFDQILLN